MDKDQKKCVVCLEKSMIISPTITNIPVYCRKCYCEKILKLKYLSRFCDKCGHKINICGKSGSKKIICFWLLFLNDAMFIKILLKIFIIILHRRLGIFLKKKRNIMLLWIIWVLHLILMLVLVVLFFGNIDVNFYKN